MIADLRQSSVHLAESCFDLPPSGPWFRHCFRTFAKAQINGCLWKSADKLAPVRQRADYVFDYSLRFSNRKAGQAPPAGVGRLGRCPARKVLVLRCDREVALISACRHVLPSYSSRASFSVVVMDTCPSCGSSMVYRYNLNWARSAHGAEYAWVCVADVTHVVEDDFNLGATG